MYVDLVDALRCPRPHDETWLVAAAHETRGRCIVRGSLGCPVCEADFPIAAGVADLRAPDAGPADALPSSDPPPHLDAGERAAEAMRLAALLDLTGPGGIVALGGAWDAMVDPLLELADVRVLLLEPAHPHVVREPVGAAHAEGVPLATGQVRGVALDAATATPARLAAAVRALRPGGRLVAPAATPMPDGARELARDDRHWVAERTAPHGPVIPLRRAG